MGFFGSKMHFSDAKMFLISTKKMQENGFYGHQAPLLENGSKNIYHATNCYGRENVFFCQETVVCIENACFHRKIRLSNFVG